MTVTSSISRLHNALDHPKVADPSSRLVILSLVILLSIGALEFYFEFRASDQSQPSSAFINDTRLAHEVRELLESTESAAVKFALSGDNRLLDTMTANRAIITTTIDSLSAEYWGAAPELRPEISQFLDTADQIVSLRAATVSDAYQDLVADSTFSLLRIEEHMQQASDNLMMRRAEPARQSAERAELFELAFFVATVVLVSAVEILLLREIRNRRDAELRSVQAGQWFETMLESLRIPIIGRDREDGIVFWNHEATKEFQHAGDAATRDGVTTEIDDHVDRHTNARKECLDGRKLSAFEVTAIRQDGSKFDALVTVSPMIDREGKIVGTLSIFGDITNLRNTVRLQRAIEQRDILVREIHHSIKNSLQGLVSIIQLNIGRNSKTKSLETKLLSQIRAIATTHGLLGRNEKQVHAVDLLRDIADNISTAHAIPKIETDFSSGTDSMFIKSEESVPVALIITELLTNAVKHQNGSASGFDAPKIVARAVRSGLEVTLRNQGRVERDLAIPHGADLGNGLQLVAALLPIDNASLAISCSNGEVSATLFLSHVILGITPDGDQWIQTKHENKEGNSYV